MSRVSLHIPTRKVVDGFVKVAPNVDMEIRKVSDDQLATLYAAHTGGTTVTQPVASDSNGELTVIVDPGSYYAVPPDGAAPNELFEEIRFDTSTGLPGSTWYSASGAPSVGTGANGDYYFRTDTGEVYLKSGGAWSAIADLTGPAGSTGSTGAAGKDAGVPFTFQTATTNSDPGSGKLKFSHGTLASATALYISETDADGNGVGPWLATFDDSTSTVRGLLAIRKGGSAYAIFSVTGSLADNGSWDTLTITHVASSGSFANNDPVTLAFHRTGDKGDAGDAAGIELGYAQITSTFTRTGAGSSDVTGLSVTVTVGARPIEIEFGCGNVSNSAATGMTVVSIQEGATVLAMATLVGSGDVVPVTRKIRLAPSAGSHTYKITLGQLVTGNSVLTNTATSPAFISVVQR